MKNQQLKALSEFYWVFTAQASITLIALVERLYCSQKDVILYARR
jgi:hypothetical protein